MDNTLWQNIKAMEITFNNQLLDNRFKEFLDGKQDSWKFEIIEMVDGKMLTVTPWEKLREMLNAQYDEDDNRNQLVPNTDN